MRKSFTTIMLLILALLSVTAAFLARDGSLARLTGWYHFRPGMALFSEENRKRLKDVNWMRIQDLHDTIECVREKDGSWWIIQPFRDRMSPSAAQLILSFTANAILVDTLPLNHTTRASLREYGVETVPHTITLKVPAGDGEKTTIARYTLGSASPWLTNSVDGKRVLPTSYLRTDYYGRDKRIHVVSGNILSIFKNGLQGLRDPRPLCMDPDELRGLTIKRQGQAALSLARMSAESPWVITSPIISDAEQNYVDSLVANLSRLKAVRIDAAEDVELPAEPEYSITFQGEEGAPLRMDFYPPFVSPADGQLLCYVTVENRSVVFTLPVEPRLRRRGPYAEIVNAMLSLPVLSSETQSRVQSLNDTIYTADLRLKLNELRSQTLSNIDPQDIDRIFIRSRYYPYPVRLLRIPGDSEGQVQDVWMCSAGGQKFIEADTEIVTRFLTTLNTLPVAGFVEDFSPGEDAKKIIKKYGLNNPDYTLILQPRECTARAVLFGVDLPLVKDRPLRTFYLKRHRDGNDVYWVAMENGMHSIYRLSSKMTSRFTFTPESWKKRNLVQFPVSALRTLSLQYQLARMVLHYDYIGESWVGTLGDEDITLRINSHRTNYYVRRLQDIRVKQWLEPTDEEALDELKNPVFSVSLDLEIIDYSGVEKIVVKQKENEEGPAPVGADNHRETVEKLLSDEDESGRIFRDIAFGDKHTEKKTITIEIAPSGMRSAKPYFYGRIRETGELFILSYDDAQSLGGSLLD